MKPAPYQLCPSGGPFHGENAMLAPSGGLKKEASTRFRPSGGRLSDW